MMLLMVALLRRSAGTGAANVVGCDPVMRKGPIRGSALGGELHLTGPHLNPPNQTRNTIMLHPSVEALRCDSKEIAGMPPFSAVQKRRRRGKVSQPRRRRNFARRPLSRPAMRQDKAWSANLRLPQM